MCFDRIVIICSYFGSAKPKENVFFVFPPQGWVWRRCQQSRVGEERKLFVQLFHARPIVWLLKLSLSNLIDKCWLFFNPLLTPELYVKVGGDQVPKVGERFVVERGDVEQIVGILQVICISCGRTFSFYERAKSRFCDKTVKEETHFNNCVVFHLNCLSFQLLRIPANSSQLLLKRFPSRISGMVNLFCLFREQGLHLGHKSS